MKKICLVAKPTVDYTLTNAWANVTGLVLISPKTAYYDLSSLLQVYCGASGDDVVARFAINGNRYCSGIYRVNSASAVGNYMIITLVEDNVYLKKGDTLSVQAFYNDAGGVIDYTAGLSEFFLKVREV